MHISTVIDNYVHLPDLYRKLICIYNSIMQCQRCKVIPYLLGITSYRYISKIYEYYSNLIL